LSINSAYEDTDKKNTKKLIIFWASTNRGGLDILILASKARIGFNSMRLTMSGINTDFCDEIWADLRGSSWTSCLLNLVSLSKENKGENNKKNSCDKLGHLLICLN